MTAAKTGRRRSIADRLAVFAVLVGTLCAGQAIANPEAVLSRLPTNAVFTLALLALAEMYGLVQTTKWRYAALPLATTLAAGGLYLMSSRTYAAWLFATTFLAYLAWLDRAGVSIMC